MSAGLDTALARLLDERGIVSREDLLSALQTVRGRRSDDPNLTLASVLLARGRVDASDLERLYGELRGRAPAKGHPHIAGYEVLRQLGAGAMGGVYEVRNSAAGRHEALKVLHSLTPDEVERFQREAETLARFDHPNLTRIYAARLDDPLPYLTLELCSGGSLQDRLRAGPLPWDQVVAVGRALASALDYLHARGVYHRDLKPANVLFDGEGRPKLTDFGIALVRGTETLTQTGEILGTPAFMAPEQIDRAHAVDARTDVYGLAATLYASATGRPPFIGEGLFAVLQKVTEDTPDAPAALGVELPKAAEAALLRAFAKDPAQRPASAGALIESLVAEERREGRGSWLVAALVLPLLVLLGGALALLTQRTRSATPSSQTPAATASARPSAPPLDDEAFFAQLAAGRGPLPAEQREAAWARVVEGPIPRACEARLARREGGAELVAYRCLLEDRTLPPRLGGEVLRWVDLDRRRQKLEQTFLSDRAFKETGVDAARGVNVRYAELLRDYLTSARGEAGKAVPAPLLRYFLGLMQRDGYAVMIVMR